RIDLSNIQNETVLHEQLAARLGFPNFYGKNWDAFWDSITGLVELPAQIKFTGTDSFKANLPASYIQLHKCFEDLMNEYPEIKCGVSWE
ncbi:MAG: barstar family protein, partial [Gammaproteobacteria bacterium]|nr:barstar family protein [Gammaproteobacteria bacterium]